jgi:hypothetical protein
MPQLGVETFATAFKWTIVHALAETAYCFHILAHKVEHIFKETRKTASVV